MTEAPRPADDTCSTNAAVPSSEPQRRDNGAEGLFLLGAAIMVLELLWVRQWARVLGSDLDGVAVVLSAFLVGSGVGCLVSGRLHWSPRRWLVLSVIGAAFTTAWGESWLPAWSDGWSSLASLPVRLIVSAPIVLTALCLSATIPAWFRVQQSVAAHGVYSRAGVWTAALDIGSALGAVATPLALLPIVGAWGAGGCALLLLAGAVALPHGTAARPSRDGGSTTQPPRQSRVGQRRFLVAGLVGLIAFALQVVWTRLLGEVLGTSVLILGCAAAAGLLGGAVGCRALPWLAQRASRESILWSTWAAWLATQALSALWIAWLPELYLRIAANAGTDGSVTVAKALLVAVALLPPAMTSGFLIPALAAGWSRDFEQLAEQTGTAQGAGFLGGGAGALCAGLWWVPTWGSGVTLALISALTLAGAALLTSVVGRARLLRPVSLLSLLLALGGGIGAAAKWDDELLGAGVFQWARVDVVSGRALESWREREVLYSGEGNLARVSIERVSRTNTSFLRVGGRVEGSVPIVEGEPSHADLPTELLLGVLPALECGVGGRTLVIGVGGGTTVAATVEATRGAVTALEVEGEVLAALRSPAGAECFPWEHRRLFEAATTPLEGLQTPTLIVEDARAYLHRSAALWDAIVCQPSEPWLPWSAPLFTPDFYRLVSTRLTPGGVAVHWVQLYRIGLEEFAAIVGAFRQAFPRVRVFHGPDTGEVVLVGGGTEISSAVWQQRWNAPGVAACRARIGWGDHPPAPIIAGKRLDDWLAARGGTGGGEMQARLEFQLPLVGDRGEDRSGEILKSLRSAQ